MEDFFMRVVEYNRDKTVAYAKKWAFGRNPKYYNYDNVGGDCTNFISQCLYNGSKVMNYEKTTGWYYINGNNKSPSWTGVEFLYKFIVNNKGVSIFGKEVKEDEIEIGDAVILCDLDGNGVEEYKIEVQNLELNNNYDNKSMKIKVVDDRLMEKTGGIICGMSGSPILQNGKLIGVVTNVLVSNPEVGYGVFADLMIKEMMK